MSIFMTSKPINTVKYTFLFSVMTTVDPETMEKDKEGEPLKSLKKFRQVKGRDKDHIDIYGDTPCVGMNTAVLKPGKISVGDEIILVE